MIARILQTWELPRPLSRKSTFHNSTNRTSIVMKIVTIKGLRLLHWCIKFYIDISSRLWVIEVWNVENRTHTRTHTHTHTSGHQLKIKFLDVLDYSEYSVPNLRTNSNSDSIGFIQIENLFEIDSDSLQLKIWFKLIWIEFSSHLYRSKLGTFFKFIYVPLIQVSSWCGIIRTISDEISIRNLLFCIASEAHQFKLLKLMVNQKWYAVFDCE